VWQHAVMAHETGRFTTADPSRVRTRDELAAFVNSMLEDLEASGRAEWENATLERFLDALAAVADSRRVDKDRTSQEAASWQRFAEILAAATGYE
jgi:hypothetical protein